jgi:putative ABC transport system ATP-binding protein
MATGSVAKIAFQLLSLPHVLSNFVVGPFMNSNPSPFKWWHYAPRSGMVTLQIRNVSKTFGTNPETSVRSLAGINLSISDSEFVCVIGANGSGKTTLLKVIVGSYSVSTGQIFLMDRDITNVPEHLRARHLALVSQQPGSRLAPSLTIEQNMAMVAIPDREWWRFAINKDLRNRFQEVLRPLGLGLEDRLRSKVSELSGGQLQALTLAMTVGFLKPSLLLLDEHCAALDAVMSDKVMALTNSVCGGQSAAVVMVTHNFDHAAAYGDRLIIMHAGSIVEDVGGPTKQAMSPRDVFDRFMDSRGRAHAERAYIDC